MDCIFCKIIGGSIPSYKVYEDDKLIAFLDINPTSMGHTLIVPKEHCKDIDDIKNDTLMHVFEIAKILKNKYTKLLNCDGFILVQNNGVPEEVKHFHLHLIPHYNESKNLDIKEVYEILK